MAGRTAARVQNGTNQRNVDPANHITVSFKPSFHELLGIPQLTNRVLLVLCALDLYTIPLLGWLPGHVLVGEERAFSDSWGVCAESWFKYVGLGETTNLSTQLHARESKEATVSTQPGFSGSRKCIQA